MQLPYMSSAVQKSKQQIVAFAGINYGEGYSDGQLSDSEGVSSALYPCITQRTGHTVQGNYENATGFYARGALLVVDGTDLIYDGEVVGQVEEGEKHFATINTKVVIFPDKVYLDTEDLTLYPLGAEAYGYANTVTFTTNSITLSSPCYIDVAEEGQTVEELEGTTEITVYASAGFTGDEGEAVFSEDTETKTVDTLEEGDIISYGCDDDQYMVVLATWSDTVYDEDTEAEVTTYTISYTLHQATEHEYEGFDDVFVAGDAVEVSGCTTLDGNNGSHIVEEVDGLTLIFGDDIFTAGSEAGTVMLERKVPDLTCICSSDNRIFGVEDTTIYASALGDPTNFYVYQGVSTDSYAVAVGTDDDFTGCISYSTTVLFFKENCLHKLYGSYPAEYELYTYTVPGVQKGCEKSMVIINEILYYKGRDGIYAYSGSTPELISSNFGTEVFTDGVAGTDGRRYYISMMDEAEDWHLLVFDSIIALWLREGDTHAADFAQLDGVLYYLDADSGDVVAISDEGEEVVEWSMTLCPFNEVTLGRKGYSKLYLRATLEPKSWMKIEVSVDDKPFKQIYISHDANAKTVQVPIIPTRCDSFTVRISGKGKCLLKSLVREFSVGSEV